MRVYRNMSCYCVTPIAWPLVTLFKYSLNYLLLLSYVYVVIHKQGKPNGNKLY